MFLTSVLYETTELLVFILSFSGQPRQIKLILALLISLYYCMDGPLHRIMLFDPLTLLITASLASISRILNHIPMFSARSATALRVSHTNFWASSLTKLDEINKHCLDLESCSVLRLIWRKEIRWKMELQRFPGTTLVTGIGQLLSCFFFKRISPLTWSPPSCWGGRIAGRGGRPPRIW